MAGAYARIRCRSVRSPEAEALRKQVLEIRKRILGEEHPDTLGSLGGLASLYQNQGRYPEAAVSKFLIDEGQDSGGDSE